jgi:hypothetical protein
MSVTFGTRAKLAIGFAALLMTTALTGALASVGTDSPEERNHISNCKAELSRAGPSEILRSQSIATLSN